MGIINLFNTRDTNLIHFTTRRRRVEQSSILTL